MNNNDKLTAILVYNVDDDISNKYEPHFFLSVCYHTFCIFGTYNLGTDNIVFLYIYITNVLHCK